MSVKNTNITDTQLWDLLRANDKSAFSAIYKRHIKNLYNFGLKHTSHTEIIKDIIQELFIELWSKRESLPEVKHVKFYLIKSLRYKLIRETTKQIKSRTYTIDEIMDPIISETDIQQKLTQERRHQLKIQLDKLPERQREIIYLRYFQNFDNSEIAEILNVNYQSVSNLLYRTLSKLRMNFEIDSSKIFK